MMLMMYTFAVHPWGLGAYQALGVAKVWSGKARLPSKENMWKEYPGAGRELFNLQALGEGMQPPKVSFLELFLQCVVGNSCEPPVPYLVE